jgi:hypothetical protein
VNRRVLSALVSLARVHEVKETPDVDVVTFDRAYGQHGVVQHALSFDDEILYNRLAQELCGVGETVQDDPVGAELLRATLRGDLPTFITDGAAVPLLAPRKKDADG